MTELGRLQGLIERYASARVQGELAFARDASPVVLRRHDQEEKDTWAQIRHELEVLVDRAGANR